MDFVHPRDPPPNLRGGCAREFREFRVRAPREELMPGAQPSANPAQREEFEQRCRRGARESTRVERGDSLGETSLGRFLASLEAIRRVFGFWGVGVKRAWGS